MSFAARFLQNPIDVIANEHIVGIQEENSVASAMIRIARVQGALRGQTVDHLRLNFPFAAQASVQTRHGRQVISVEAPAAGAGETGIRYLPYQDNKAFSLKLGAAARIFLTAPLSGCDMHVFGTWAEPEVVHCNSNINAADPVANGGAKLTMAMNAMQGENPIGSFVRAEYGAKPYDGAMFFGVRRDAGWVFFGCVVRGSTRDFSVFSA